MTKTSAPPPPLRVGVIGSHACGEEVSAIAHRVGQLIAEAGAVLVCGGLGGVMDAASRGARDAGGITVGILPGDDAGAANPGVQIPIPSGLGEARNVVIVRTADAVVGIAGGWGTLSEAALCLKNRVPLILLKSELPPLPVPSTDSPEAAVSWALEQASARRP
jgi:uncharacterized protein (TIGR00725 family)